MYVALVVALIALVLFTAFNSKVRNSVIWLSKKTLAVLIIAFLTIALSLLALQVAILSFIAFTVVGLIGAVLWGLLKLLEFLVPTFDKGFTASVSFGYNGIETIGKTIAAKTKSVWKRWS